MNWADFIVVILIIGFGLIGLKSGFVLSMFKIASFFLSIWLSFKLYPIVSELFTKTSIYTSIKSSIFNSLLKQKDQLLSVAGEQMKQVAVDTVIENLPLPEFLKSNLINMIPDPSKLLDVQKAMETISGEMTKIIIGILSVIVLFIGLRIVFFIAEILIKGITKLPVFKQIDKSAGFVLGIFEGLLSVYIIFAVLVLFNSLPSFVPIYQAIDKSLAAKYFYENNILIDLMFPAK